MKISFSFLRLIYLTIFMGLLTLSVKAQPPLQLPCNPSVINAVSNPLTICNGTSTDLSIISGDLGAATNWYWYANQCGGIPIDSGLSITVTPTFSTTYFVRGEGGCTVPGICSQIVVTVDNCNPPPTCNLPFQPEVSSATICNGSSTELSIIGGILNDATDWQWYENDCSGNPVGTGLSITVSPTSTTTYFVRGEGGCVVPGTGLCGQGTVTVDNCNPPPCNLPIAPEISYATICNGNSTEISIQGGNLNDATDWNWFEGDCNGNPVGTGLSITVSPTSTTTYFVRGEGGCVVPGTGLCGQGTVTVDNCNPPPCFAPIIISLSESPIICNGTSAEISVTNGLLSSATDWVWYENSCGGTPIGSGLTITVTPNQTTTYFVRGEGGCVANEPCTPLLVTVNQPTTSTEDFTACSSYVWHSNYYTESGVYTFNTQNANG
ncbi:MAG: hypothetical protein WCH52_11280, partial [Bacteroidota bacterium]